MPDLPHIACPRSLNPNGSVVVNEQDSLENVAACVYAIATCEVGQMPLIADFGIPSPLFQTVPLDLTEIVKAVSAQEPRAESTASASPGAFSAAVQNISLVAQVEEGPT
jgi:hypothetical protein